MLNTRNIQKPTTLQLWLVLRNDPVIRGKNVITTFSKLKVIKSSVAINKEKADWRNNKRLLDTDSKVIELYLLPNEAVVDLIQAIR